MSTNLRMTMAGFALGLITVPAYAAALQGDGGARPGDETMTCQEIAAGLQPYMQQIVPTIQALGASDAQLMQQSKALGERHKAEDMALAPVATAGALDPTGAAKRAYQLALMAQMAKQNAEKEALANSPQAKENKALGEQMAAQGKELQSNARLQRLMQLGQEKHCDKR
jgi:hypothetical protein